MVETDAAFPANGGRVLPLVSAIMPTYNRPRYVSQAINCFLQQSYSPIELVILDGGESIEDLIPDDKRIRYFRLPRKLRYGEKLNHCCSLALGEVICHWDDDDFSAASRVEEQVGLLLTSHKSMVGYHSALCFDERSKRVFRYSGIENRALGSSLCYLKSYWRENPFLGLQSGADNYMTQTAASQNCLLSVPGEAQMVFRIHPGNTSPKFITGKSYQELPREALPKEFDCDLYRSR